jgi:TolB-like protein
LATSNIHKNITIAILPFQDTTQDDRIKLLILGFTEDLVVNFSKFVGLSVISYYSTQRIKDITNQDEIDSLGADYLVMGNVRNVDEKLRISIQLIKTEDHSLVFAGQHNETLDSLLEAQDRIIQQIVGVLQEKINYNLLSHSYKKKSVELAAYENYLLGMNELKKGSKDSDIRSRVFFNSALDIDQNFSLAFTGLSLSYFNFWSCVLWERWDESMKGAHKFALKAIEHDPNDYLALGVLGRTYVYKEEFDLAEHNLRKSLRMNTNDASHLLRVSFSLMYLGYADEALNLYHKAIEINPFHSDVYFAYGSNYYLENGDFESSIELSKKVKLDCWTDFAAWIAAAYLQLNDLENMWKCWDIYLDQFERIAYSGKLALEAEAVKWLDIINPFKGKNFLTPLCDFIIDNKNIPRSSETNLLTIEKASFHYNGEVWEIGFNDKTIILKDAKGLQDIHKLMLSPSESVHCLDLMGSAIDEFSNTDSIDAKSKAQYLKRIKELQIEIEETDSMNQIERITELREEYDSILDHLSNSLGMAGKSRKIGSTVEKARSAVTWRIRNTIKKIQKLHPELGLHLSNSIKTGTHCSYHPEIKIDWAL